MVETTRRKPFKISRTPRREIRPESNKLIFLSCEGNVTEEEYFGRVTEIYDEVKSKIQFISIKEEILVKKERDRTEEEIRELGKSKPWQLLEKIEKYKEEKKDIFDFDKHPDDEFWIVSDVDENTAPENLEKRKETLNKCREKGYDYAISNPFFEIWLLLHHSEITDEDKKYGVTNEQSYEPTDHFKERLAALGVPLVKKKRKHIVKEDYDREKIKVAIERGKKITVLEEGVPKGLGTSVYKLLEKIEGLK